MTSDPWQWDAASPGRPHWGDTRGISSPLHAAGVEVICESEDEEPGVSLWEHEEEQAVCRGTQEEHRRHQPTGKPDKACLASEDATSKCVTLV